MKMWAMWVGALGYGLVALGCSTGSDTVATAGGGGGGDASGGSSAGGSDAGGSSDVGTCRSGVTMPPVAALISDFSDVVPNPTSSGDFLFGGEDAARVQGGTTRYSNRASTTGTLTVKDGALSFAATLSAPEAEGPDQYPFNGFGLYIDGPACVDGSAYDGVSFTLSGDLGDCLLHFSFTYADGLATTADPLRGKCTASNCYPAEYEITTSATYVNFVDIATIPGVPAPAVDSKELVGVQWQLVPSGTEGCTATITVDDVKFQ